jgi:hypothetical protein
MTEHIPNVYTHKVSELLLFVKGIFETISSGLLWAIAVDTTHLLVGLLNARLLGI